MGDQQKFWRCVSKPTSKPLYFIPQIWKPWNIREFNDINRMRSQNLVFELHNLPDSKLRKISLVTRLSTPKLNANVQLIMDKYGIEKPEERASVTKNTISLGAWFLEKNQIPHIFPFAEVSHVHIYLDQWNELNNGVPQKIARDIHKKVRHNISVRNEMKEEFDFD